MRSTIGGGPGGPGTAMMIWFVYFFLILSGYIVRNERLGAAMMILFVCVFCILSGYLVRNERLGCPEITWGVALGAKLSVAMLGRSTAADRLQNSISDIHHHQF